MLLVLLKFVGMIEKNGFIKNALTKMMFYTIINVYFNTNWL